MLLSFWLVCLLKVGVLLGPLPWWFHSVSWFWMPFILYWTPKFPSSVRTSLLQVILSCKNVYIFTLMLVGNSSVTNLKLRYLYTTPTKPCFSPDLPIPAHDIFILPIFHATNLEVILYLSLYLTPKIQTVSLYYYFYLLNAFSWLHHKTYTITLIEITIIILLDYFIWLLISFDLPVSSLAFFESSTLWVQLSMSNHVIPLFKSSSDFFYQNKSLILEYLTFR